MGVVQKEVSKKFLDRLRLAGQGGKKMGRDPSTIDWKVERRPGPLDGEREVLLLKWIIRGGRRERVT